MRYGVMADVHGNLHALDAALEALDAEGVQRSICAGDLVGYGPFPNECLRLLASRGVVCVAGNHDLMALDRLSDDGCIPLARQSLRWTREVLTEDARRHLAQLPLRASLQGGVVMAHGSLADPWRYVTDGRQAERELAQLRLEHTRARILVLGHTHRPMAHGDMRGRISPRNGRPLVVRAGERYLLNPGSVGQSRQCSQRARFLVLDLERATVTFRAVRYDVEACRRALRDAGLPPGSCHLPQRWKVLHGALGRVARRAA